MSRIRLFTTGLLFGGAVGYALGVLYAPHRGRITRGKIRRGVDEAKDRVIEAVEDLEETVRSDARGRAKPSA